jgi:hypothetical protein
MGDYTVSSRATSAIAGRSGDSNTTNPADLAIAFRCALGGTESPSSAGDPKGETMNQTAEPWPGNVQDYRSLLSQAEAARTDEERLALTIAAQIAGVAYLLDKIAYLQRSRQ